MPIYEDGYLNWSASQHRQVKSICSWAWVLQRIDKKEVKATMGRAVGSTGHKVAELALKTKHHTGRFPDHEQVNKWSDEWFYYYIERDGHRLLSYEKEYYKSDKECIEDYATLTRQLSRKCIDECIPTVNPALIDGELALEVPWDFKIEDFKIKMRGRIDVIEQGNIVSDFKFKGTKPLIKKGDSGGKRVKTIDMDEQFIVYSAAIQTVTGEYPTVKAYFIIHQKNQDVYDSIQTKHNGNYMQILYNNMIGIRPLIDEAIKTPDIMLPASEYSFFCSDDMCDYWNVCDKHY